MCDSFRGLLVENEEFGEKDGNTSLPGLSIRCYTRGLIGGSPRKRRQTEIVKEEEPQLLFCADNQICMISGQQTLLRYQILSRYGLALKESTSYA